MEIFSGVHGNFKITKPSKFSNVQRILKPWLTMVAINFRAYSIVFPIKKNKMLFAILYLVGTIFNWVQPRLENFWENDEKKTKAKNAADVLQIRQFLHLHKKGFRESG